MKYYKALIFVVLPILANGQLRKYSNEFLNIGVGAQYLGTGNTAVATVNNVTAGFWNPAGLVPNNNKSNIEAILMHSEYFAGLSKYDYAAVSKKIDTSSAFSISAIRLAVDDIPNTLELIDANGQIDYNRVTRFSAADYGFLFSYGRKLKIKGLSIGATAKIIHRKVGSFAKANGFGVDFGMQYKKNGWQFGLMAKDITTTFNAWSFTLTEREKLVFSQTENIIPKNSIELTEPKVILGIAKKLSYKKLSFLTELNIENTFFGQRNAFISSRNWNLDPRMGIQVGYAETIWLRGGLGNVQQIIESGYIKKQVIQPNIGLGFRIPLQEKGNLYIDYALANVGQQVGLLSHLFSIRADIFKN